MFKTIILHHPQSADLLQPSALEHPLVEPIRISCGTTKSKNTYAESGDFFPTYASWNSILFETSVILTVWEHADTLIGNNNIAFLHTDTMINDMVGNVWSQLNEFILENPNRSLGITMYKSYDGYFDGLIVPDKYHLLPKRDPMMLHHFDNNISVWEYIKKYDFDLYEWANDTQPIMICAHQFACSRNVFDYLGDKLFNILSKLKVGDTGLWTPHMFERLIALYLARHNNPIITSAFWHYASSGISGPGELSLYGPRPIRFYKTASRWNR